ncbi:MAG TPA: SRPBCC family protein [Tepidisphaeraceae bacterium]|jgi:uncharacterized membrane protein/uncharacterized protein YwbE|nr:SRPBCC family protein [Tepidisphaeraceae bacterium]
MRADPENSGNVRGNDVVSRLKYAALGAGLMYVLDPDRGHRRRKLIRDQLVRMRHEAWRGAANTATDLLNHTRGAAARVRSVIVPDFADDWIIRERVRSAIGRAVTHPHAIRVSVSNGRVMLGGPILECEVEDLLAAVRRVRGVREVRNLLEPHAHAENLPALQGRGRMPARRRPRMRGELRPAMRLLLGGAGLAAARWGLRRRGRIGAIAGAAGAVAILRRITRVEITRASKLGLDRRAVTVRKTITLSASVAMVFYFFADYTGFPHFMSNVKEVRALGGDRSRWVVAGPMGVPISWDAELTEYIPYEVIAWRSLPGAVIENAGVIRFEPEPEGTRVDIHLAYNPPAGVIGHLAARMFGADPKNEMDADLARVKRMIETGRPAHDAAKPMKAEVPLT